MYRSFARSIEQNGRIYEFGFMLEYFLKTNPFAALKMLPMAFSLLTHKRMPLLPKAVAGRRQLNQMFRNISTGGSRGDITLITPVVLWKLRARRWRRPFMPSLNP